MSTKIHPDTVLRQIVRDVKSAHYYSDFIPDMERAPHGPAMRDISESGKYRFIVASSSTTMLEGKTTVVRWFNPKQQVELDGRIDNGNRLNRLWARYSFPRHFQDRSEYDGFILPPYLSFPGYYDNMAQLDVRSAYYSIIRVVGLYPNIRWGKTLAVSDRIDGYPFHDNKVVRNSLYGMCFAPKLTFYTRGVRTQVIPKRKVYNVPLMQIVQCCFHGMARQAYEMGAVQWHTDGGIMPLENFWSFAQWATETYGVTIKLKATGKAHVYNPAEYFTDAHTPRKFSHISQYTNTINGYKGDYDLGRYEQWLQGKLAHWVRLRGTPAIVDERIQK